MPPSVIIPTVLLKRLKSLVWVGLLLLSALPARSAPTRADSLLTALKQALQQQPRYDARRLNRLAALTAAYSATRTTDTKFDLGLRIYDEYKAFKYDSAFAYSRRLAALARRAGRPARLEAARLRLSFVLLSAGLFKETFDTLATIRPARLSRPDQLEFYFLQARAYGDLADFSQDAVYRPIYYARSRACLDTALQFSRPGSYEQLSMQQLRRLRAGDLAGGLALYPRIRQLPGLSRHQLAVSASTTAFLHAQRHEPQQAFELLLVAALADVQSATKETRAMFQLSDYCYRRNDLENAYLFIREARENAAFYKARQRQVEIGQVSSLIEGRKIDIIERQRHTLRQYAVLMTLLAAAVIGFAALAVRQLRKLRKAGRLIAATNHELHQRNDALRQLNDGLNEANRIKQEYLAYYFHNNSQYIDKLAALKQTLDTQLGNQQYAAARKLVGGLNSKQERQELLRGFDTVFLRLFPHFIAQFNGFFGPDDQLQLPDDQLLNTELRIFALIRLGITDSEQISRMLGYSINTIYTYKTRVKNRALVPNEEFEARVQALPAL